MFRAPLDQEFLHPGRAAAVSDASRLGASQYVMNARFVSGGIATPEGFDGCDPAAFGACLAAEGPCLSPDGEVQKNAGAMCAGDGRLCGGPLRERSLYGELFGCIVYS